MYNWERIKDQEPIDPMAQINELVAEFIKNRTQILESFAQAYIAETGVKPSEAEMVMEKRDDGTEVVYFRKRELEEPLTSLGWRNRALKAEDELAQIRGERAKVASGKLSCADCNAILARW